MLLMVYGVRRALLAAVGPDTRRFGYVETFLMSCIMMLSVSGVALAETGKSIVW